MENINTSLVGPNVLIVKQADITAILESGIQ
jgi:hypothetical protein